MKCLNKLWHLFVMLCYIYCSLTLLMLWLRSVKQERSTSQFSMLFWVLASFWVRSSKEALQDWSPRERKSVPFRGNFELRPLGVAMGTPSAWPVSEAYIQKTPPVGRRPPMTSLPARPQYKGAAGKIRHPLLRLQWLFCLKRAFYW